MSYIRCLSNPEGLYIVCTGKTVTIMHSVLPPHSSGKDFYIPVKTFEHCALKDDGWAEKVEYRGMKIEEIHVGKKSGKIIPDMSPCNHGCKKEKNGAFVPCKKCVRKIWDNAEDGEFLVRISYKRDFVNLWRVTWQYVVENIRVRYENDNQRN